MTAPYIKMMEDGGWRSVTFKQAYRELRMELEDAEWAGQPINPNKQTMLNYYGERIKNGAESHSAYWTNK